MRKFIGTTEIEPLAIGILQIASSFGFEALRYSDITYIRKNCAVSDLKLAFECLFTFTSRIAYIEMSAPY